MSFISHLRIGRRLTLAFGIVVALTLASAVFSQWRLREVQALASELVAEQSQRLALAFQWRQNIAINFVRSTMMGMLTDQTLSMALAEKVKATSAETSALQTRFEALEFTPGGRAVLAELARLRQRYLAQREVMIKAGEAGTSIAAAIAKGQAIKGFGEIADEYLVVADKMVRYEQQRGEADGAAIAAAVRVTSVVGLACAAVCVLSSILLGVLITRSIVGPVRAAQQAADRIASGDLTGSCAAAGSDETSQLANALDTMQESLKRIVREIRSATEAIQLASTEVASGNQDLSVRTEQTASSLQQAASSMDELNSTVHHSAQAAGQANGLASTASEIASRGGSAVAHVVRTMDEINTSSRKIGDIIGVIDGIAFQTNILALNAAVEAARAGEQGRGFAVVASEVRSLAQRSAGAAREIKALIGASVDKVENGARLVRDAGTTMEEIVGAVRRVSEVIGEITTAAGDQAGGIQLVNDAVGNVEQMTQQNAALVEQSAAAAESMRDQASRLAQTVEQFRTD